jgi:hypothetical protein
MTIAILGWLVAGICIIALVTLWFVISFKELSIKKKSLDTIGKQVQLHRSLCMEERGGENDAAAHMILENKLMVYRQIENDYNALIRRPMHRIPAYIMGFHPAGRK